MAGKYLVQVGRATYTLNRREWDGRGDPRESQWTDKSWWRGQGVGGDVVDGTL